MISGWQILIILLIVVLLFGTKKLRTMGSDLGAAVKGFKDGMNNNDDTSDNNTQEEAPKASLEQKQGDTIDGEVIQKDEKTR